MDSVIMTTPSSSMRLRSRLRSAANQICARNRGRTTNRNHNHHNLQITGSGVVKSSGTRTNNTNCVRNFNLSKTNGAATLVHNLNHRNNSDKLNRNHHYSVATTTNDNGNEVKLFGHVTLGHVGTITREVYNAWCGRLGDVTRIPSDSVQALFNDMQLYPSKNQVLEMLQCARQCSRRTSSQFLTFGEFCVFAGELRRGARGRPPPQHWNQVQKTSKSISNCEVFLGGSCNPTTWRADIAIPALSKLGISYYNPQVSTWGPELMAAEHEAKESAAVLLFVVDSQTRCVAGMLEVAHLVAKQRLLVLVVHPFHPGQAIMGETLSPQEFVDLSEGQSTLLTLLRNQGIMVHNNLTTALQCTVSMLRGPDATQDSLAERKLTDKLMKLREVFDSIDLNRTGALTLPEVSMAYYQLTGSHLRITDLRAIMDVSDTNVTNNPDEVRITFEQFCGIMAEFTSTSSPATTEGCRRHITSNVDEWVNQPLQRQSSTNNNNNSNFTDFPPKSLHQTIGGDAFTPPPTPTEKKRYDIYLGGSCMKRTSWRQKVAIPLLKKYGVTYYNPSLHENGITDLVANLNNSFTNGNHSDPNDNDTISGTEIVRSASRDLQHDIDVMADSKIVMFVITNETRSITSMILAAHFIALRKNVILCLQQLPLENSVIGSDSLSKQAIKDYNRARAYLCDLAKHENVPLYEDIKEAVQYAITLVQTETQAQRR